jgi:ketosteroid isomerase-like protein
MTNTAVTTDLAAAARASFVAGSTGDFEGVLAGYHPDLVWTNDSAAGPWAGTFEGTGAVATMFIEFTAFMEGTFAQELLDVCASDEHVAMLLLETGMKDGYQFRNRAVYLGRYKDGLLVEMTTLDRDREAAAAFWQAVVD